MMRAYTNLGQPSEEEPGGVPAFLRGAAIVAIGSGAVALAIHIILAAGCRA